MLEDGAGVASTVQRCLYEDQCQLLMWRPSCKQATFLIRHVLASPAGKPLQERVQSIGPSLSRGQDRLACSLQGRILYLISSSPPVSSLHFQVQYRRSSKPWLRRQQPPHASSCRSAKSGYLKSACSSKNCIHAFRNLDPLCDYLGQPWVHKANFECRLPQDSGICMQPSSPRARPLAYVRSGTAGNLVPPHETAGNGLTYLPTVSESPMTHRRRLGRVMATVVRISRDVL